MSKKKEKEKKSLKVICIYDYDENEDAYFREWNRDAISEIINNLQKNFNIDYSYEEHTNLSLGLQCKADIYLIDYGALWLKDPDSVDFNWTRLVYNAANDNPNRYYLITSYYTQKAISDFKSPSNYPGDIPLNLIPYENNEDPLKPIFTFSSVVLGYCPEKLRRRIYEKYFEYITFL